MAEAPQIAVPAPASAVCGVLRKGARQRKAGDERRRHREYDQDRGRRAERRDLAKRDPQAEQRHRPAQYGS